MTLLEIEEKYRNGEITYVEFQQMLNQYIANQSQKQLQLQDTGETTPLSPDPVYPYLPQSDVFGAISESSAALVRKKMREGLSEEQAQKEASEEISRITRPTTVEYTDPAQAGISRVDIEKGIAFDEMGRPREAGTLEKLSSAFGRQVIGRTEEAQRFFDDPESIGMVEGILTEPDVETGQLVETPVAMGLRYLNVIPGMAAAAAGQFFPEDLPKDLESETYRVVDKKQKEDQEWYSQLSNEVINAVLGIPFSAINFDTQEFVDQAALNIAKNQGMGNLYQNAYIPEFLDEYSMETILAAPLTAPLIIGTEVLSGGDRAIQANIIGSITEAGYPVVPFSGQIIKGGQSGLRALAQGSAEAGNISRAKRVYALAHPIESTFLKANTNKVVSDMRGFGMEASADELLKPVLLTATDTTPQAMSRTVKNVSQEKIGEHIFEIEMLKEIDDVSDLMFYSQSPTMKSIYRQADPTGTLKGEELLTEIRKVASQKSNEMRAFAEEGATQTAMKRKQWWRPKTKVGEGETANLSILNKAEARAKAVKELSKGSPDLDEITRLMKSPLLTDYFDELGKIQLGLRAGSILSGNDKIDMSISVQDLILKAIDEGDVSSILQAGKQSLAKDIGEKWLNFLPEDLHVVVGNRVVPTEVMQNKKLKMQYNAANKKIMDKIKPEKTGDPIVVVGADVKDDLIKAYIKYAGADKIRQSEVMQDILLDLKRGMIKKENYNTIQRAVQVQNAEDVLGAKAFTGGGEQFRRALVPVEAKKDIIATTREKSLYKQLANGRFGNFTKDFITAVKALRYNGDTPLFVKTIEDVDSDLLRTMKTIDSKRVQIPKQFEQDLQARMSKYTNAGVERTEAYARSMDEIMYEVHEAKVAPMIAEMSSTVARVFNNDWLEYLHLYMNDKYGVQILNQLGIRGKTATELPPLPELRTALLKQVEQDAKQAGLSADVYLNQQIKKLTIDYARFSETMNEWSALVKDYYGENLLSSSKFGNEAKDLSKSLKFKDFITIGDDQRFAYDASFQFLSRKSSYLDVSYTNFLEVIRRLEDSNEVLRGRGMKSLTLTGLKKNTVYTPTRWVIGAKEGQLVQREMTEQYFNAHPEKLVDVLDDFTNFSGQQTYDVLETQYKNMLSELPLPQQTQAKKALVSMHLDILTKITSSQRKKMMGIVFDMMGDATNQTKRNSVYPDLQSIKSSTINDFMEAPMAVMESRVNEIVAGLKLDKDVAAALGKDILEGARDIMFFGSAKDNPRRYVTTPSYSAIDDAMEQVRDFFRLQGIVSGDRIITEVIDQYPMNIVDNVLRNNPQIEIIGGVGLLDEYKTVMSLGREGKLAMTMDRLRQADKSLFGVVYAGILNTIDSVRRISTQGMLSGFPVPNAAYHGQNILTQPILAAMTLGWRRAGKSYNSLKLSMKINQAPRDQLAFVSDGGRQYSIGELQDLANEYNIGMTRQDIELYISNVDEILRGVDVDVAGKGKKLARDKNLRKVQEFVKNIDPRYRTLYSTYADNVDMTYRRAVFFEALKEDMDILQAVDLAQKSLLDYGAMGKTEKAVANRLVLFWSFSRQSGAEFINSISKAVIDGDGNHQALLQLARMQQKQHQASGDALYETDQQKARLYKFFVGQSDGLPMYSYGFSNPYVEAYEGVLGAINMALMIGEGRGREALLATSFRPETQAIIDNLRGKESKSVPSDFVYGCKAFGVWDWAVRVFDINERPQDERRIQEPVFGERAEQYEFYGSGGKRFKYFQLATVAMGIDRFMREGSRALMTLEDPEKVKRFGEVTPEALTDIYQDLDVLDPIVYLLGVARPLKTVDPFSAIKIHQRNIERELEKLYKDLEG